MAGAPGEVPVEAGRAVEGIGLATFARLTSPFPVDFWALLLIN